jgi:hypothetical protein
LDSKENYYLSEEDAEWVGLKKSEYLSRLIGLIGPTDIGFEEYHKFDDQIHGTITTPDRTYVFKEDGRDMRTYLKSYLQGQIFHQIVLGVIIPDDKNKSEIFVPVLIFVTRSEEVVKEFATGESKNSRILN